MKGCNACNKVHVNLGPLTFWLDEWAIQARYDEPNSSSCGPPHRDPELAMIAVLMAHGLTGIR